MKIPFVLCFTLATALITSFGAAANEELYFEKSFERLKMELVGQQGNECGPVSLSNSLLISPRLSRPIQRLSGMSTRRQFEKFLQKFGPGRYSPDEGIDLHDLVDMANDFAGDAAGRFVGVRVTRLEASDPVVNLPQILDDLRQSARNGFLPVLFVVRYSVADGKYVSGHFVIFRGFGDVRTDRAEIVTYNSRNSSTIKIQAVNGQPLKVQFDKFDVNEFWSPVSGPTFASLFGYVVFKPNVPR
jgi:hypothetical protein